MKLKTALDQQPEGTKIYFKYNNNTYSIEKMDSGITVVGKEGTNIFLRDCMNIDKCTDKYLTVYSYNMMSQKSVFKFPIDKMKFFEGLTPFAYA